ncbi:hypothetical protein V6N13_146069 [Hibiscus sabdariffa]|uniref:Uncharacterized protein n=1 Tax=Hibiscus sabdariffa TaxID=183260 RepID=A0ABR2TRR3_9ROSI
MNGVHDTGSDLNPGQVATLTENRRVSVDKKLIPHSHSSSSGDHLGECSLVSFMHESRQSSDDDPATPTTRTLAGEQPIECSDRTPSHVFARTTGSPREWSMRSNESLFSLYTGNVCFTPEQLTWMSKSGEFYYGYDSALSSPLPPGTPWNNISATEMTRQGGNLSLNSESSLFSIGMGHMSFPSDQMITGFDPTHYGQFPDTPCNNQTSTEINKGNNGENKKEATNTVRERESQVRRGKVHKEPSLSYNVSRYLEAKEFQDHKGDVRQEPPDARVKSFAFPILTGHTSKNGSPTQRTEKQNRQSWCSTPETPKTLSGTADKPRTPETPKLGCSKETRESPSGTPKPQAPKPTRNGGSRKWFACFSCCSCSASANS